MSGYLTAKRKSLFRELHSANHQLPCSALSRPNHAMRKVRGHAPLSPCFWIACSKLQVDQVLENMIPHFPYEVEGVLGNGEVNYRRPPNASLDGQGNLSARWLVYVDIFTVAVKSKRETEATR
jgi:hypothetical protein